MRRMYKVFANYSDDEVNFFVTADKDGRILSAFGSDDSRISRVIGYKIQHLAYNVLSVNMSI